MSDIRNDLDELGKKIVADAQAKVPVQTGKLKSSIESSTSVSSNDSFTLTISELSYGKFVNNGTKKMKAQPFMTKAIEENLDDGIKDITKTLTEDILSSILKNK